MKFKFGDTYQINRGPGKPYKIYVLAIIDGDMVVYKWYGRHKQWWHYEIEDAEFLEWKVEFAQKQMEKEGQPK